MDDISSAHGPAWAGRGLDRAGGSTSGGECRRAPGSPGRWPQGPAWPSSCCVSCRRLALCCSRACSCRVTSWRGPSGLWSWLCGEQEVGACSAEQGAVEGAWSTCRSAMEATSLCSRAQATELALTPRSCSRRRGRRAPARSKSSRSRTTQWSHTVAARGQGPRVSTVCRGQPGVRVNTGPRTGGKSGVMARSWGHPEKGSAPE